MSKFFSLYERILTLYERLFTCYERILTLYERFSLVTSVSQPTSGFPLITSEFFPFTGEFSLIMSASSAYERTFPLLRAAFHLLRAFPCLRAISLFIGPSSRTLRAISHSLQALIKFTCKSHPVTCT